MTEEAAILYVQKRMDDLGYKDRYRIRLRHFVLSPREIIKLDAFNEVYIIISASAGVRVESDLGVFLSTLNTTTSNEMLYEHQGKIKIENTRTQGVGNIKCLQAIIIH